MIVRNALAALGFLGVVAVVTVAIGANRGYFIDDPAPPRLRVNFRGLDLTTPEGLDVLDRRIAIAIYQVCNTNGSRDLSETQAGNVCRANAWAGVRPQIDRAVERARYERRTGYGDSRGVFTEIARQPYGMRASIREAIGRSFISGITANWYGWGAKGLVFVGAPYVDRALTCRQVTVTSKSHGQQDVIAEGPACRSPYGVLETPLPA